MTPKATVAAVRDLHRRSETMFPECLGCDNNAWDVDKADWPCRTAGIVYTIAEINAVVRAAGEARAAFIDELARP